MHVVIIPNTNLHHMCFNGEKTNSLYATPIPPASSFRDDRACKILKDKQLLPGMRLV